MSDARPAAVETTPVEERLLTVAEVAELLRVNPQAVRNWLARGLLAGVRVGPRRIRVRGADVERFLAEAAAAQGRPGRAYVIPSLSRPAASGTSAALDPPAKTIGQAPDRRARLVRSRSPRRDGLGAVASRPVTGTRDQRGELACALDAVAAAVERLCRVLEQEAAGDVA